MGYNKIFLYKNCVELYKYERDIDYQRIDRHSRSNGIPQSFLHARQLHESTNDESVNKKKREDNARCASVHFKRLVKANLGGAENPLFLTLTYRENITDLAQAYRDFTAFTQALRYRSQPARYICVPEFQKRGSVHFHVIVWEAPKAVFGIPQQYPPNAVACPFWNLGFAFLKETDGHARIANYLAKYMAKAFQDPRLAGRKAYTASRNVVRPVSYKGISNLTVGHLLDDFLSPDMELVTKTTFDTMFLGRCELTTYKKI